MNPTTQRFFEVLTDGVTDQICIDADELAVGVDLAPGQTLTWLASASVAGEQVHVFFCECDDDAEEFMLTRHGAAGQLIAFDGPYLTFAEAQRQAGPADAGWTDA